MAAAAMCCGESADEQQRELEWANRFLDTQERGEAEEYAAWRH